MTERITVCVTLESAHLFNTIQHINWEDDFFYYFLLFLTGWSRNEMSPCSIRGSYMEVVKLIPASTRASPVAGYLNKSDRTNNHLTAASFYYMHNKH